MTAILEPTTESDSQSHTLISASQQLQGSFSACRVKFKWFGTRKSLNSDQKTRAAQSFGADGKAISAAKRLFDTQASCYRNLTSTKSQINMYWRDSSLPYPEPGIRLIRNDSIEDFNSSLISFRHELEITVVELNEHYAELKEAARQRLGSLYSQDDYPNSLLNEFQISWDFPSVAAPDYLRRLSPEIYRQECQRVQAQFSNAVALTEQMFQGQLAELVDHLVDRLSTDESGETKDV